MIIFFRTIFALLLGGVAAFIGAIIGGLQYGMHTGATNIQLVTHCLIPFIVVTVVSAIILFSTKAFGDW